MPTLIIPTPLRIYTRNQSQVSVQGTNVGEAIQNLVTEFPSLQQHLYNKEGVLRPFVNLFLGSDNVNDLQGLQTHLSEDAQIRLIPSIAGGNNPSSK
jgi:molybdopterin converting factor small subunit